MKITVDVSTYIDDLIKDREGIIFKVDKIELKKNLKDVFEEYLEELVYSAFDCMDMETGILEKLESKGIIEYK